MAEGVLQEAPPDTPEGGGRSGRERRKKEVKDTLAYSSAIASLVLFSGWNADPSPIIAIVSAIVFFGLTCWIILMLSRIGM